MRAYQAQCRDFYNADFARIPYSTAGIDIVHMGNPEIAKEVDREREEHQRELDSRNPLVCKFLRQVMHILGEAIVVAKGEERERLQRAYRFHHKRLRQVQGAEREYFYLFCNL